jgi:hypothetical protein
MSRARPNPFIWMLAVAWIVSCGSARAGQSWTVSLDTSALAANYPGPFGLDFELVGGNGNTVTLSSFSFGSGGIAGPGAAFLTGGAGGNLGGSVSLNDRMNFFSDFNQQFTPGGTLAFTMESTLTAPPPGGIPDNFSMVIFENYDPVNGFNPFTLTGGTPIPTTDPSGSDTFLSFDLSGPGSTSVMSFPSANGDIPITVISQNAIPEPGSGVLMLLSVACTATAIAWRSRRARLGRSQSSSPV